MRIPLGDDAWPAASGLSYPEWVCALGGEAAIVGVTVTDLATGRAATATLEVELLTGAAADCP